VDGGEHRHRVGAGDVRVGKHIELDVDAEGDELAARVEEMCAGFLTNPVVETYRWRVITDAERADAGAAAASSASGASAST
jgi:phosphoribosylformylglycinamidine (FGAM) synthase PurS component